MCCRLLFRRSGGQSAEVLDERSVRNMNEYNEEKQIHYKLAKIY